jgi:hypothetical protein
MLIAMPFCCNRCDRVKKEDVHPATWVVAPLVQSSFRRPHKGMRRALPVLQTTAASSYATATTDNKRVVTRDLYLRTEAGLNPGSDTVPRFGADGKMQFSTVTIDSGGSLGVPGSVVIQGDLTVNGLINGGGGGVGGGGGGVSVVAGPSGNVTVATAAGVATVDLAPLLTGIDISGDIDVTGELEAKSLRVLTGAIVDGAFSAGSVNVVGNAHVEGELTGGSTITATGKIRSTTSDIEAINGILSGALAVNGAATVGSLIANQTVTVAGNLNAKSVEISDNAVIGGNLNVAGVITAAGLSLTNAFQVNTLQVLDSATISGDLYVNSTLHHVGLFDPPIGGNTTLLGGPGIDVTENPSVAGEWTITNTGGSGGSGGISGVNEGSNIEVSGSGTNPTVGLRINQTLDLCNNKITNVDIIELVSTATDTEDPRISFKDVNGFQRAQVEYNQDNQTEPILLMEGPRVLIEATEADNVSGITLATAANTLTVTNEGVDLGIPMLTMDGVEISVDGSNNMMITNTNAGGGYRFTSVPDVSGASGFDDMLVYNVATGEIRQTPAPMGTDICGGTNILVDKSTPAEPVVSLEVREDIDMGGKGLVFASSVGFFSGGSIIGDGGSLRITEKVGIKTAAGVAPVTDLEVNGEIQATKLYLTGVANAGVAHLKVLGYKDGTGEIELQDAGGGGGAATVITAGKNIDIVGDVVSLAVDQPVDMGGQDITNAGNISGSVVTATGAVYCGAISSLNNIIAVGRVSAHDINGNNILSFGNIRAVGTVSSANISTDGNVTATGNISGGLIVSSGNIIAVGTVSANRAVLTSISLTPTVSPTDANDMYYDGINLYFRGMIVKMVNPASYIPGVNIEYFTAPPVYTGGGSNTDIYLTPSIVPIRYVPFERTTYGVYSQSMSMTVTPPLGNGIVETLSNPYNPFYLGNSDSRGLCVLSGWFKPTDITNYKFYTAFTSNNSINVFSFYINGSRYTVDTNIQLTAGVYYKIDIIYEIIYPISGYNTMSYPPAFSWTGGAGAMFVNNTAC